MANPLKGEVDLVVGTKTYTLCFPSNRIVEVETLLGQPIAQIAVEFAQSPSFGVIRTLLWAALREHQGKIDLLGAGAIMDDIEGGLEAMIDPIGRALRFRLSRIPVDQPLEPARADRAE